MLMEIYGIEYMDYVGQDAPTSLTYRDGDPHMAINKTWLLCNYAGQDALQCGYVNSL